MTQFAELLHKYMERTNITDSVLAKKLDIKRETVFRWRKGIIKSPTCNKVEKSAKLFGLNPVEYNDFLIAAGCPNPNALQIFQPDVTFKTTLRPITQANQFFGRKDVLARIFSAWESLPLEHVAIIGPKQSGKTSLLNYLYQTQCLDLLPSTQRLIQNQWIFIDFKNAQVHSPESFMRYALKALNLSYEPNSDLTELTEIFNDNLNKPTIILMENIEYGLKLPMLDELFWGYLRYLGGHVAQLGYCVTSRYPLLELEQLAEKNGKPSPLVNIFTNEIRLQAFTESEAREFLNHSSLPQDDIEWILQQNQFWPVLLQIWCKVRLEDEENWQEIGLKKIQRYIDL